MRVINLKAPFSSLAEKSDSIQAIIMFQYLEFACRKVGHAFFNKLAIVKVNLLLRKATNPSRN